MNEICETFDLPDNDEIMKMNEDELEDVVDDHDLGVDLDKFEDIKAKRKAVADAVEEKEKDEGDKDGGEDSED